MEENSGHKRRVRYKGTHPKKFKEKYKELNPEKYADEVEKIKKQGKTPAGTHVPIMVKEIMDFLQVKPGQVGMDATLGYGGHSAEILKALQPHGLPIKTKVKAGKLFATDVDPIELPKTKARLEAMGFNPESINIRKMNFGNIDVIVHESGPLNFVLADLGVSSMQIDDPERGFSFKIDGPLDLRLNPKTGISAADFLKTVTQQQLEEILVENSDEPYAEDISGAIYVALRKGKPIDTTSQLKEIISSALVGSSQEDIRKACQRTFQALRIAVNKEFEMLEKFLEKLPDALAPGGRVAILTFHSGEDRRVKKAFQHYFREGIFSDWSKDPVRPSAEECFANPRAKAAKMRWGVR